MIKPVPRVLEIKKDILAKNDEGAKRNRGVFADRDVVALNFVSSPGAGKTSLLVKTITDIKEKFSITVLEGDQSTSNDARRIAETGVDVTQINTVSACHLDASMIEKALHDIDLSPVDFLFIENVGNLVCPASYDLGELMKIALVSVTEGDDKPEKYPKMFRMSQVLLITKTDLLPHVDFDVKKCIAHARIANPDIKAITLSSKTGVGLDEWYSFLTSLRNKK